jgi:hypothetical protein
MIINTRLSIVFVLHSSLTKFSYATIIGQILSIQALQWKFYNPINGS